jgi:hypothetical protein
LKISLTVTFRFTVGPVLELERSVPESLSGWYKELKAFSLIEPH